MKIISVDPPTYKILEKKRIQDEEKAKNKVDNSSDDHSLMEDEEMKDDTLEAKEEEVLSKFIKLFGFPPRFF